MSTPPNNLSPQAIGQLGIDYWHGWGVQQSYALAVAQFRIGAAGGDAASHFWLGVALAEGKGAPKDEPSARRHMSVAAKAKYAPARDYLATLKLRKKATKPARSGAATLVLLALVAGAILGLVAAFGFQQPPMTCAAAVAGGIVIVGGLLWLMRPEKNHHAAALAAVADQQIHGSKGYDEGSI